MAALMRLILHRTGPRRDAAAEVDKKIDEALEKNKQSVRKLIDDLADTRLAATLKNMREGDGE